MGYLLELGLCPSCLEIASSVFLAPFSKNFTDLVVLQIFLIRVLKASLLRGRFVWSLANRHWLPFSTTASIRLGFMTIASCSSSVRLSCSQSSSTSTSIAVLGWGCLFWILVLRQECNLYSSERGGFALSKIMGLQECFIQELTINRNGMRIGCKQYAH